MLDKMVNKAVEYVWDSYFKERDKKQQTEHGRLLAQVSHQDRKIDRLLKPWYDHWTRIKRIGDEGFGKLNRQGQFVGFDQNSGCDGFEAARRESVGIEKFNSRPELQKSFEFLG